LFVVRRASQALLILLLGLSMAACTGGGESPGTPDAAAPAGASPTKFSNPTEITNPLFPTSRLEQLVYLGQDQGDPLRVEVTRLPGTKRIDVNGTPVDAVKMQFLATSGTTILETANDYFAQADDGTVWYLGEHVNNYENGVVADHEGTWVTGEKRPDGKLFKPGVIMPAKPAKGDVFFPENNKPFVFEKVTVEATGLTIPGPRGAVGGAIKTRENLLDGTTEEKTFAPGYVEHTARVPFGSKNPEELVGVAIAVPTDKVDGPQPRELTDLATTAGTILTAVRSSDWTAAASPPGRGRSWSTSTPRTRSGSARTPRSWTRSGRGCGTRSPAPPARRPSTRSCRPCGPPPRTSGSVPPAPPPTTCARRWGPSDPGGEGQYQPCDSQNALAASAVPYRSRT
jgi:hypothetical protein